MSLNLINYFDCRIVWADMQIADAGSIQCSFYTAIYSIPAFPPHCVTLHPSGAGYMYFNRKWSRKRKTQKSFYWRDEFLKVTGVFSVSMSQMSHHSDVVIGRTDLLCGEKLYDRGLQRLEAMLYAVDRWSVNFSIFSSWAEHIYTYLDNRNI